MNFNFWSAFKLHDSKNLAQTRKISEIWAANLPNAMLMMSPYMGNLWNILNLIYFSIRVNNSNSSKHLNISSHQHVNNPLWRKWCKHLSCLRFSFSLDLNHLIFPLLSVFLQDNCRDSQRGKNCYIMSHCTRICLSWMRTRLSAPSFSISIISCDPFDPMLCPLIYRAALRNDCMLWRLRLLSMWVASSSYRNLDSYISFKFVLTLQFTPSPLV